MAEAVHLSSDQGDADDQLVTASGQRVRDTQLARSTATLDWTVTSPSVLRRVVMTQDGSNAYSLSVSGQWLRVTSAAAGGNQREAYLFPDSVCLNSEIDTVLGVAGTLAATSGQWGNIHQAYRDSSGLWHIVACWTDTTIGIQTLLNFGVVTFTGALNMNINNKGNSPIGQALDALRYLPITRARRATNVVTLWTPSARLPPVNSTGDVESMAAVGFNVTARTITAVDRAQRTVTYTHTGSDATDADAGGVFKPASKWAGAFVHLRSRLQGNVLSAMLYHSEEGKPDWSDADRVTSYDLTGGSPTFAPAEGFCGLWSAHLESGNTIDFGGSTWRRL